MCGVKTGCIDFNFLLQTVFFSKADNGGMRFIRLRKQQTQTKPLSAQFIVGFGVFVGFVDEKENIKLVFFFFFLVVVLEGGKSCNTSINGQQ